MSRQDKESLTFWAMWSLGPIAATLAIAATGVPQALGEGYLTFIALFNAMLAVAAVNSTQLLEKIAQAGIVKRTPGGIEWATIGISVLVGIALGNIVLIVCPVVYGALKHRLEHLYAQPSRS